MHKWECQGVRLGYRSIAKGNKRKQIEKVILIEEEEVMPRQTRK